MVAQQDISKVTPQHFKSKERVREQGEVFTQEREIHAMLNLMPAAFETLDTTFLEPAAGNGNFLVQIFRRKIRLISERLHGGTARWFEFAALRALASIYAIEIDPENVEQARERMLDEVRAITDDVDCLEAASVILETNVILGDSLKASASIQFVRYTAINGERFQRTVEFLEQPDVDLFYQPPAELPELHFSELKAQ